MLRKLPIHLVPIGRIRPSECHDPKQATVLAKMMRDKGVWHTPVMLERRSLTVMDGHHRLAAARLLELKFVPCLLLDYNQVEVNTARAGYLVTPQEIVRRAQMEDLYPPKTIRHLFSSPLPPCDLSLWLLEGREAIENTKTG